MTGKWRAAAQAEGTWALHLVGIPLLGTPETTALVLPSHLGFLCWSTLQTDLSIAVELYCWEQGSLYSNQWHFQIQNLCYPIHKLPETTALGSLSEKKRYYVGKIPKLGG